jgi:hypothetical protein
VSFLFLFLAPNLDSPPPAFGYVGNEVFPNRQMNRIQKRKTTQPLSMEIVPPLKVRAALRLPGRKPRTLKPGHFSQTTTLTRLESSL